MTVTRSNGAITLDSPWFVIYTGTTTGKSSPRGNVTLLKDQQQLLIAAGRGLSSKPASPIFRTFASDDQTMSGTELNVYPLNTGETLTYNWNWQAIRRN